MTTVQDRHEEAELASGRVWKREAIEKWARATGREILEH
jgi:hypothetical protein